MTREFLGVPISTASGVSTLVRGILCVESGVGMGKGDAGQSYTLLCHEM
jgi:hypothetical protein